MRNLGQMGKLGKGEMVVVGLWWSLCCYGGGGEWSLSVRVRERACESEREESGGGRGWW